MAKKKKIDIDRDDDDVILKEMAKELDCDVEDLTIEDGHPFGFSAGPTVKRINLGSKEYYVVQDDDAAYELAREYVQEMLSEEPGNFEPNFIESHINIDRLRRDLYSDVHSSNYDYASEIGDDRFWEEAERWGIDVPEEDEDGERREPTSSEYEQMADAMTEEQLKDPMEYLRDIYGDEAAKRAIEIAGIDIDAAAEEAVRVDGAGHFLSSYDGNLNDTAGGLTYWRHN